jgi:molybdate transport repressor ModE-like protein
MKTSLRFDLVDLRLFLHVTEAESITHGASRAGMTLASASERIRAMEEALGAPLLERNRRGISLTPAGSALAHHARIVVQQLERMRGELTEYAQGLRGHVRLLSNTAATAEFLPAALGAFLATHPHIDIDLEERPSPEIVRAVAAERADIGIVADVVDAAAELETFPFAEDRLVLVVPRQHALARHRQIAFRHTLEHDHVGLVAGSALQQHVNDHAARAGHRLKLRVRLPGFDAVCRVVESGIGLAVVPATAARRCRRAMAIRIIPLTDAWAVRRLRICVRSFRALPAHAQWLVEHLSGGSPKPKGCAAPHE